MADDSTEFADLQQRNKFRQERSSFEDNPKKLSSRGSQRPSLEVSSDDSLPRRSSFNEGNNNFGLRKRSRPDFYDRPRFNNRDSYRSKSNRYNDGDRSPREEQHSHYQNKKGRYNSINYQGNNTYTSPYFFGESVRSSLNDVVAKMSTFKDFMLTMDDNIHPEDAVDSYFDYVKTFSSKQLDPFFKHYNECDWMMLRFHPQWKDHENNFIRKCYQLRLNVFNQLYLKDYFNEIVLDSSDAEMRQKLYHLLIFLNILLECGDFDEIEECQKLLESTSKNENSTKQITFDNEEDENDDNSDKVDFEDKELKPPTLSAFTEEPNVEGRHRIVSFNIKAVPINASREELYKCYGNIEGFLRAYVSEPSLGKRDFRRAFLTFKSDVDVTETTKSLNLVKFRENVNLLIRQSHELNRRVRIQELKPGCHITKKSLTFDLEMIYKLIKDLDNKFMIYNEIEPIPIETTPIENTQDLQNDETNLNTNSDGIQKPNLIYFDKLLTEEDENQFNNIQLPKENPIFKNLEKLYNSISKKGNENISENEIKKVL